MKNDTDSSAPAVQAKRTPLAPPKTLVVRALWTVLGALLSAIAINLLLVPLELLPGGVSGAAVLLDYLLGVPAGIALLALNLPLFAVAWRHVDRTFAALSVVGLSSFVIALLMTSGLSELRVVEDRLLGALFGGAMAGAGAGIGLKNWGSLGGADIVGVLLRRRYSLKVGEVILGVNAVIVGVLAIFRGLEPALLTLLSQTVATAMLDRVLTGMGRSKAVFIVTGRPGAVGEVILRRIDRGATLLSGEGAFGHTPKPILFTVVPQRQLAQLKRFLEEVDPDAFVTVLEANEVIGRGFLRGPAG